jgi:hypothetical protein
MRILIPAVSAGFLLVGALTGAQAAQAAQVDRDTYVPQPSPVPSRSDVQPLDCNGTTGDMGCGPGWSWRDGWRGWACYPC